MITTDMEELIKSAAELIAQFNPSLAVKFQDEPLNRVTVAHAFARGFVKEVTDDPEPLAVKVIEVAYLDRRFRQSNIQTA
jgi:hypothetical protein